MAVPDPIEDLPDPDEDYHESSDEDFNPTTAPADDSSSSDQEDAPAKQTKRKGKRKVPTDDELDSGDEVTIDALRKRRAKKRRGEDVDDELLLSDDDAGAGGLIKTRAQRRVEYAYSLPRLAIPPNLMFVQAERAETAGQNRWRNRRCRCALGPNVRRPVEATASHRTPAS